MGEGFEKDSRVMGSLRGMGEWLEMGWAQEIGEGFDRDRA